MACGNPDYKEVRLHTICLALLHIKKYPYLLRNNFSSVGEDITDHHVCNNIWYFLIFTF